MFSRFKIKRYVRKLIVPFFSYCGKKLRLCFYRDNNLAVQLQQYGPDFTPYEEGKAIRIVFLVMKASIWPSISSVWKACISDKRFSVKVVLVGSQYTNECLSQMIHAYDMLISRRIPFFHADSFSLKRFKPHVVFFPIPYADMFPAEFSPDKILRLGGRIAYIPYGISIIGGGYITQYRCNLFVQQTAWRIFVRSKKQFETFARYCKSGCGHVVVTGHPKFDYLQDEQENQPSALENELKSRIGGRRVILWTPHFLVEDTLDRSTFTLFGEKILSVFDERLDVFLIIRPHPLFFARLRDQNKCEQSFRERIRSSENIYLDEDANYLTAFRLSDALLADAGSFLTEYLVTSKPIMYLELPNGLGLNDEGDIVDVLYRCQGDESIGKFIAMVALGEDPMKERRLAAVPEFLFGLDGNVGKRIADHVHDAIVSGDDFCPHIAVKSKSHRKSLECLEKSKNSCFVSPEYYDRLEHVLRELLSQYPKFGSALDIGCGNGRYTRVFVEHASHVTGIDVSKDLLKKAEEYANEAGMTNIVWRIESLDKIRRLSSYDLVSCFGVLSEFIDDKSFLQAISLFGAILCKGGVLLVTESLSLGVEKIIECKGCVAVCRNVNEYILAFDKQGFVIKKQIVLSEDKQNGLINILFVFVCKSKDDLGKG